MATTKITSPDLFNLESLNTALKLPSGTTAQRPTSPSTGEWRYNTTTNLVEFWDGGEWRDLQSEDIPPIPSEHFNVVLWTGTGSAQTIEVGFQPDMIWYKARNQNYDHNIYDSTRGLNVFIRPNSNIAQYSASDQITGVTSTGFTLGTGNDGNQNGTTFVAWCWKANGGTTSSNTDGTQTSTVQVNTKAGFSIVQYTASAAGSSETVGHGLGTTPAMIILKRTDAVEDWYIWHKDLGAGSSALNQYLRFTTASQDTATNLFNTVNSTVFNPSYTNGVPNTNIAYCFAEKSEYSSFGSYTGNGSTNGPIVNTGFEPAYIMIKNSTAVYEWTVYDNKRSTSNPRNNVLYPNTGGAENSGETGDIDFLTNGFQLKAGAGSINQNGGTIIYAAFASDPSAAPTLTNSFKSVIYSGVGQLRSIGGVGFSPNLVWIKMRNAVGQHSWFDTSRGPLNRLDSTSNASQSNVANSLTAFNTQVITYTETLKGTNNGFTIGNEAGNSATETNVAWMWKAATLPTINTDGTDTSVVSANVAAGFSIAVLPNKAGTQNLGHGLDGVPDLIIMKQYAGGTGNWSTYNSPVGVRNFMNLNSTAGNTVATPGYEFDAVTATTITNLISGSTYSYIYYCWKNVAGFSKVGSYSGNSSTQSITGLGFQPNWVMIKRYNGTENWYIQDSARGSTKQLYANLTDAEFDETNAVTSFDSDGFTMGSYNGINNSGEDYIYIAYKDNPAQPAVASGEMEYLVVAGGGGSSADSGGGAGGGAGGLRTSYGDISGGGASAETAITLAAGTYTITVGAGGTKYDGSNPAQNGGVSSITGNATVNTVGGGAAGSFVSSPTTHQGADGGSGGGSTNGNASVSRNTGGAGTSGEGFFGGGARDYGPNDDRNSGGGGGGAAEGGSNGQSYLGGNGGNGLMVAIDGTSAVYAGGGGGGCRGNTLTNKRGAGGEGGGGYGANTGTGTTGTANTGGGGGGGRSDGVNGGSGVVILRMNTSDYSGSTTGSPTVTTIGSETILTYTGSGTYVHS